jgi:hypothetical protein
VVPIGTANAIVETKDGFLHLLWVKKDVASAKQKLMKARYSQIAIIAINARKIMLAVLQPTKINMMIQQPHPPTTARHEFLRPQPPVKKPWFPCCRRKTHKKQPTVVEYSTDVRVRVIWSRELAQECKELRLKLEKQ